MSKLNQFAVFILSHGRPHNIKTLEALEKSGYTGKIYIIIDDQDKMADEYFKLYGDSVIKFNKDEAASRFDMMNNRYKYGAIVFARNESLRIAEQLGLTYYLQLDDDYTDFSYRFLKDGKLSHRLIKNLDVLFENMLDFLDDSGALTAAMAQGGDFIGGLDGGNFKKRLLRKAMNTFFCRVDRKLQFVGNINEDVNMYVDSGRRGELILTVVDVMINQLATQQNAGGMSDLYLDGGTYVKSFYSVMIQPSSVKVSVMGESHMRLHHKINWNKTVPKILNERYKK